MPSCCHPLDSKGALAPPNVKSMAARRCRMFFGVVKIQPGDVAEMTGHSDRFRRCLSRAMRAGPAQPLHPCIAPVLPWFASWALGYGQLPVGPLAHRSVVIEFDLEQSASIGSEFSRPEEGTVIFRFRRLTGLLPTWGSLGYWRSARAAAARTSRGGHSLRRNSG